MSEQQEPEDSGEKKRNHWRPRKWRRRRKPKPEPPSPPPPEDSREPSPEPEQDPEEEPGPEEEPEPELELEPEPDVQLEPDVEDMLLLPPPLQPTLEAEAPATPIIVWRKVDHLTEIFQKLTNDLINKETGAATATTQEKQQVHKPSWACDRTKPVDAITQEVCTLEQLIELGDLFTEERFRDKNYSVNIEGIYRMRPALRQLQSMIGLEVIKTQILEQIMFFTQELHRDDFVVEDKISHTNHDVLAADCNNDMYHTIIFGCPGVGKTAFAKILARIYLSLGITKKDVFVTARRSDLIGEYLGHTAVKTQKKIDEAIGGVLFIDEAYSLGCSTETKTSDSYSKECIDTLNQNLTEKKGQFICIIAGYKEEIEKNLFSVNPGLRRRFSFAYTIKGYTDKELAAILALKIKNIRWTVTPECQEWLVGEVAAAGRGGGRGGGFFGSRMESFPNFAGDVETLLLNIKIAHARRTFGKDVTEQKSITRADVEVGYSRYLAHRGLDTEVPSTLWRSMYS